MVGANFASRVPFMKNMTLSEIRLDQSGDQIFIQGMNGDVSSSLIKNVQALSVSP